MVKEMHMKTISNSNDRLLLVNEYDRQRFQAYKRRLFMEKLNTGSRVYSRPTFKSEPNQFNQFMGNLSNISSSLKNAPFPTKIEPQRFKRPEEASAVKCNGQGDSQKSSKSSNEGQKSRTNCRNQTNKPSATTTLWNMDICNMLGMPEEEIPKPDPAPPNDVKEESKIIDDIPTSVELKPEKIKNDPESSKIQVELARGNRFGAYETLVARLRERGRTEFLKGGPGCAQSCRDSIKTNPVEEIINQRLYASKYSEVYDGFLQLLRNGSSHSVSTSVFDFGDMSLVHPHEEDDCTEERLVMASYGDVKFPAIRRDGGVFVRLADINNEVVPAKDTRSLQSKCKRLDIPLLSCTDTELNLLINFANSPPTKSHHVISLSDTQKLLDSLLVDRRRRKVR